MASLTITRGLPGSGKSYWAKQWLKLAPDRFRVNRDNIRYSLFHEGVNYSGGQEQAVSTYQHRQVDRLLAAGFDVVIDDTNLNAKVVRIWQRVALANHAEFIYVNFTASVDQCIVRVAQRVAQGGRDVDADVIYRMADRYLSNGFSVVVDITNPLCASVA
jgi:predicted kinase